MSSLSNPTIRALRIHAYGGSDVVQLDQVARPRAAAGQVVVRVGAVGVNGFDWKVREGFLRGVLPLALPVTLGIELAGEVIEVADGVTAFAVGDRVMGPMAGLGAYADEVAVAADKLAATPASLNDVQAAAIPVAALTAWQALFDAGELAAGQTVLIHGAAGGVGGYAVQFAKRHGVRVVVTSRAANAARLQALGADEVIDYERAAFQSVVKNVDLVLDLVGGTALDNSWALLTPTGRIVSTAAPDVVERAPQGQRGIWFQMRPDAARLSKMAEQVAAGELMSEVSSVVDLSQAAEATEQNRVGHARGKTVVKLR